MRLNHLRAVYEDYPKQFWLLVGASFIDMVGNALIFPFFALFMTDRFDVSVGRVGVIFALFSISGIVGSTIGGALTDRFGRKPIALTSLLVSAAGNLCIGLANDFSLMYPLALMIGLIGSIGHPAWQAMMADLLPEEKRIEGFGVIRILFNVAVMFGPIIGGLLAGVSYVLLFSVDAAASLITASILLVFLRETRPQGQAGSAPEETLLQTFQGYRRVLRDTRFITFILVGSVVWLVYFQMNTTLAVYLRDEHGIQPQGFGLLLSMNALMVVALQFWFTRQIRQRGYPSLLVLAAGTLLYAIGFSMFGYVSGYALFVMAMIIITIGEMLAVPTGQAVAVQFAPEHMRGRYMAVLGFGFAIASGSGPWLAGQVIATLGFEWVWYFAGVIGMMAVIAYLVMYVRSAPPEAVPSLEEQPTRDLAV
ncbi:MAG: MFS transporter [Chloroflexi bacterium]|nr:MFS transporter [Chloroflexota bacterium]